MKQSGVDAARHGRIDGDDGRDREPEDRLDVAGTESALALVDHDDRIGAFGPRDRAAQGEIARTHHQQAAIGHLDEARGRRA